MLAVAILNAANLLLILDRYQQPSVGANDPTRPGQDTFWKNRVGREASTRPLLENGVPLHGFGSALPRNPITSDSQSIRKQGQAIPIVVARRSSGPVAERYISAVGVHGRGSYRHRVCVDEGLRANRSKHGVD